MPKKYIPKATQQKLEQLAKGSCEYCKILQAFFFPTFTNEHIIPTSLGGSNELSNLAKACYGCNGSKFTAIEALDPVTNKNVPLFHPRKDSWRDHFKWSDDYLLMIGLTPTGRATILRLKMNRPAQINLRKVTIGLGHPPD